MKKLMLALALVGMSSVAMAQTEEVPTLKNSVQTNGFWSNWFLTVGGSYNAFYSSQEKDLPGSPFNAFRRSWGAELTIGKWFTPGFGVRIKGAGIWATQVNGIGTVVECPTYKCIEVSAQAMFNLNNLFCGYKPRVWNIYPYLGIGFGHSFDYGKHNTPLWQIGINNQFNLSKRVFLNLDIYYQFAESPYDGVATTNGNAVFFSQRDRRLGASLSLGFNLGKVGWDAVPDVAALTALHASQLAALNEQLAEQEAENARLKALLAKPLPVKEVVRTVKEVGTSTPVNVFFNIGQSKIASKKDLVNVQALVDASKDNAGKYIVTGYADSKTGSADYNKALSERRANAVADELVKLGVDRNKIEVNAEGGVDIVNPSKWNRRVVVEVK